MSDQEEGFLGRMVGAMIRRSVKARFRNIYWQPPASPVPIPALIVPNHHGWFDGYIMFLAMGRLGIRVVDWIEEYDAFPLFGKIGGLPYPRDDAVGRAATIRKTIRLVRDEHRSLLLFAEGRLHRPPELYNFGRSLELMVEKAPLRSFVPVGIIYDFSLHERPECFVKFGPPQPATEMTLEAARSAVSAVVKAACDDRSDASRWQILFAGTADVNERFNLKDFGRNRKRNL